MNEPELVLNPFPVVTRLSELPGAVVRTRGQIALAEVQGRTMATVAATLAVSGTTGQARMKAPDGSEWSVTIGEAAEGARA